MDARAEKLETLVDSHCHLTWDSFDADFDAVLARMDAEGVRQAVVVATDPESARRAQAICAGRSGLFPTAGIHPNDLKDDWEAAFAEIEELLASGEFVAVGETGLDYYRDRSPVERQHDSFDRHCALAKKLDLPIIVHIRDKDGRVGCYDDIATIIERHSGLRGVIHCYTGPAEHAERYRAAGFYISFSGVLTFPKGQNVRDVAAVTPLDATLVETDAPFLTPAPHRGGRNEPSFVAATARRLAELKGVSDAEVRRATTANARALFRLPEDRA